MINLFLVRSQCLKNTPPPFDILTHEQLNVHKYSTLI